MPWDETNYPKLMERLRGDVRAKAIDIANELVENEGYSEDAAIDEAIERARQWNSKSRGRRNTSAN